MPAFMNLRDIGLFLHSARTDARIERLRPTIGSAAALEAIYAADSDPWSAASARYRYQHRKYEVLISLLPPRRFARALDLGCGLGLLSRHLASRTDNVVGIDVAPSAVARARVLHADQQNLLFEAQDLLSLPSAFDGSFDLVVVADVLYYLSPLDDALLKALAMRIAALLAPDGMCMLANHYFFRLDPESRRSRRIHDAFSWSPGFVLQSEHRRPFFLTTLLQRAGGMPAAASPERRPA
ncbi:class I SAM-dependent methyltransferase [Sphingomonas sp. PL20]|uniref:class I SAM-dependent methyltransferase n=1 Tax=Sphingomonas sp. PL20 TaxID=2760712 RepID=UPI001AE94006